MAQRVILFTDHVDHCMALGFCNILLFFQQNHVDMSGLLSSLKERDKQRI